MLRPVNVLPLLLSVSFLISTPDKTKQKNTLGIIKNGVLSIHACHYFQIKIVSQELPPNIFHVILTPELMLFCCKSDCPGRPKKSAP